MGEEVVAERTDTERLDWLQNQTTGYGGGWRVRKSAMGRGMRLQETSDYRARPTVREAIDEAMRQQSNRYIDKETCEWFIEKVRPTIAGTRVDDGSEPWVCEWTFVVEAVVDGVEYRGIGMKRNDLRDGSEQITNAREHPLFGDKDASDRYVAYCRQRIVTLTQVFARNEAIKQIITESGWT